MSRDYKQTLRMPTTAFAMKANLNLLEPTVQKKWLSQNIYQKLNDQSFRTENFILHDGPPFANGNLHLGHALNKILKDMVLRRKIMEGYKVPYFMGWDTHGLPIELAMLKKDVDAKKTSTAVEFRQKCRNFANDWITKQREQFNLLGIWNDPKLSYNTSEQWYELAQIEFFLKALTTKSNQTKLIYRDKKPVYWSWSSQSALAENELEYKDRESNSIYFASEIRDSIGGFNNVHVVIWTTTPWTLPSNRAIAFNEKFQYVICETNKKLVLLGMQAYSRLKDILGLSEIKKEISGKELKNKKANHPYVPNQVVPLVQADFIIETEGTGIVHLAPGFGQDDYEVCKKEGIEVFCPMDSYGKFTHEINDKDLAEKFFEDTNATILEKMRDRKTLLHHSMITHSVAHDWRTKKPIVFRATEQWFINLETLKPSFGVEVEKISFYPHWAKKRLSGMLQSRTEWCISRQRLWGVPIPIFYENEKPILEQEVLNQTFEFIKKNGVDSWYSEPAEKICSLLKTKNNVTKDQSIMDVWMDSGLSYNSLTRNGLGNQADLYLEGSDQFRGWFNSSMITSVIQHEKSPYKSLYVHGFVVDTDKQKMSKSAGNGIDPIQVIRKSGAEILRLWVACSKAQEEVVISEKVIETISETYRKIRNSIFKYCLSNLDESLDDKLVINHPVNQIMLNYISEIFQAADTSFKNYEFDAAVTKVVESLSIISGWYLDIIKDSLYCDDLNSTLRKEIVFVCNYILNNFLVFFAPILPHTAEEVYDYLPKENKEESVFLDKNLKLFKSNYKVIDLQKILSVVRLFNSETEKLRAEKIISKNSEVSVTLNLSKDFENFTNDKHWQFILNSGPVKVVQVDITSVSVEVLKNFIKCERCWLMYPSQEIQNDICQRCHKVIITHYPGVQNDV